MSLWSWLWLHPFILLQPRRGMLSLTLLLTLTRPDVGQIWHSHRSLRIPVYLRREHTQARSCVRHLLLCSLASASCRRSAGLKVQTMDYMEGMDCMEGMAPSTRLRDQPP